jgi:hypothetical protein
VLLSLTLVTQVLAAASLAGPCDSLPPALASYLHRKLPAYQIIPSASFDSSWRADLSPRDQTDGAPNCITADFDGNGFLDYVLTLRHGGNVEIMAFQQADGVFHHVLAFTRPDFTFREPLNVAVFRLPPGRIYGPGFGDSKPTTVETKNASIDLVFLESSSVVLYWSNGHYVEVWTSD